MINLLPPTEKQSMKYARRNSGLRKWIIAMLAVMAGLLLVLGAGWIYIGNSINTYQNEVAKAEATIKLGKLEDVQKNAQNISDNIKLIVQVLNKQIIFSELLRQIGRSMPNGSILSSIEISKTSGGLDLQAAAKDYKTATQVQVNLQDPGNKLFQKADLISVSCGGTSATNIYPCTINLRALFGTNNPYLFVNQNKAKQ